MIPYCKANRPVKYLLNHVITENNLRFIEILQYITKDSWNTRTKGSAMTLGEYQQVTSASRGQQIGDVRSHVPSLHHVKQVHVTAQLKLSIDRRDSTC